MTRTLHTITAVLAVLLLAAPAFAADRDLKLETEQDKVSYSIGLSIGQDFKRQGIEVDVDILSQAISDVLEDRELQLGQQEVQQTLMNFKKELTAKREAEKKEQAEKNLAEGKEFLEANAEKEGVVTRPSGLQYKILEEGSGESPTKESEVTVDYKGTLVDGTVFDSSYQRGKPATFGVSDVIAGWTEALPLMKEGAKWRLFIPAELAYGEKGAGPVIGPNATLIFDVELKEVN